MSFKRVLKNYPYGINSCNGSMFVFSGSKYFIYKDGKWREVKYVFCGYLNSTTDEKIMRVRYAEINCEDRCALLYMKMNQLLDKEKILITKMMIFDASNDVRIPELSLMIAEMCFELGVM